LEILEMIGAGGMGAVFKARQPKLDRFVALKILSESLAEDPAFAERFSREARMLARLNHPGIVTVYDFGKEGELFYLMMEYVDGVNLREAMAAGTFSASEALAIVPKICEALQFAHETGVLHRDIKPENILLDERGRVKIADFGIAKLLGDKAGHATLTAHGSAVGTPHYMAPEQLETPKNIDERADIYSLGVVFYELLTGQLPIGRFALPSESSAVDPRVDPIVLRTLERDREKRYRTATEVRTNVEGLGTEPPLIADSGAPGSTSPGAEATKVLPKAGPTRTSGKAIASTILSCLGLALSALWIVFILSIVMMTASRSGGGGVSFFAVLLLGVGGFGCLGFLVAGLLFGVSAIHDLREAQPPRRGMGLAVFGVVAGPLLVLDVVLGVTLQLAPFVLMSALNVLVPKAAVLGVLLLVTLPVVLLVDWLVVRRVWSWAQGTHGSPRKRPSPNASRVAFAIVALIVAALVLLLMIPVLRSGSPAPIPSTRSVLSSDEPAWLASGAHLNLSVTLPPRQVATFSLVRSNAVGLTPLPHYSAYVVAADREPFQGNLQWGWIENEEESTRPSTVFDRASAPSAAPLFQVQVHDSQSGRATTAGPLLEPGAFSALKQLKTLRLQAGRNEVVLLAEPHPSPINAEIAAEDSLWVNIVTTARPQSTDPTRGRSTALIGAGNIDWETALDE
jgi:tRNA A-37 threonylcarbamoyl transferase component Bud32